MPDLFMMGVLGTVFILGIGIGMSIALADIERRLQIKERNAKQRRRGDGS